MKKNLILTGMMGVGKSTLGKALSTKLKMNFFDTDAEIEKRESLNTLEKENCIIALGGGAFINKEIRDSVKKNSISFWLNLNVEFLMKRLSDSKKRPLLKFEDLEKNLEVILQERKDKGGCKF